MESQLGFAASEWSRKKKQTKRGKFLAQMEEMVPWQRLVTLIAPHYPKGEKERPPKGIERMLRVYFLQQRYVVSPWSLDSKRPVWHHWRANCIPVIPLRSNSLSSLLLRKRQRTCPSRSA